MLHTNTMRSFAFGVCETNDVGTYVTCENIMCFIQNDVTYDTVICWNLVYPRKYDLFCTNLHYIRKWVMSERILQRNIECILPDLMLRAEI